VNELFFSANNGGNGQEPYRMSIPAAKPDEVEDREAVRPEATVQTPIATPEIKVYPNPAVDYVRVDLPENASTGTLTIFDANGRQVREVTPAEGDTYVELSLQEYSNGIYWVRWMQKDATPVTKKLTVQH
jgi:Secretion system C-terminal sorting domain